MNEFKKKCSQKNSLRHIWEISGNIVRETTGAIPWENPGRIVGEFLGENSNPSKRFCKIHVVFTKFKWENIPNKVP